MSIVPQQNGLKKETLSKIRSSIHENIEGRGITYTCLANSQRKKKIVIVQNMIEVFKEPILKKDKET